MKKILIAFLGISGLVWFFQGINIIPNSFMTGDIRWAIAGISTFGLDIYLWKR
jgi:hypothetical protein